VTHPLFIFQFVSRDTWLTLLSEKNDGGCFQNKQNQNSEILESPTLFVEEKSHLIIEKFVK
jgi:hypothetical protein